MNFQNASFRTSYGISSQLPKSDRPEIVFCGRSNVGKSSLINKLTQRKALARTSSVPGKTATINFYSVDHIYFVDLPGYGFAKTSKGEKDRFSELIGGFFGTDRDIPLVALLIDSRHAPSKLDISMADFLIDEEFPFIIVFTKCDKLSKAELSRNIEVFKNEIPCFEDITVVYSSSETGAGIEEIRKNILLSLETE